MTMAIEAASQQMAPDPLVDLYILDASAFGGGILRWCDTQEADGGVVKYNGSEYPVLPFECEGFAWDKDTPPRPKITASLSSDTDLMERIMALAITYKGGQGALIYRIRTLARYLDGHEDAGHSIEFPRDMYIVDRIVALTKSSIQWELISPLELPNCELPSRQALRDYCPWIYRHWDADTGQFIYVSSGTQGCPYTGTNYYDKAGNSVAAAQDVCGHRLSDCVLRYGADALPYGGFPGLTRGTL